MTTAELRSMTTTELLDLDSVIGRELDSTKRGRTLPPWTEGSYQSVLDERRDVRAELELRRNAARMNPAVVEPAELFDRRDLIKSMPKASTV